MFKPGNRVRSIEHVVDELPYGYFTVPYGNGTVLMVNESKPTDVLVKFDSGETMVVPDRVLELTGVMGPVDHFREVDRLNKGRRFGG